MICFAEEGESSDFMGIIEEDEKSGYLIGCSERIEFDWLRKGRKIGVFDRPKRAN